jgi:hypothetical protein
MAVAATLSSFAGPVSYQINFTTTSGTAPATGTFTYNSSLALGSQFTSFTVTWDALTFNFASNANAGGAVVGTLCGTSPTSATVFAWLTGTGVCSGAGQTNTFAWLASATNGSNASFALRDVGDAQLNDYAQTTTSLSSVSATTTNGAGTFTSSATPAPSTWMLALAGGALLLCRQRVRRIGK